MHGRLVLQPAATGVFGRMAKVSRMACRGVFFALNDVQASSVLAAVTDDELMAVIEDLEESWDQDNLAECDKAWDAMHRCLSNGKLDYEGGTHPLNRLVLSDTSLYQGGDYIVCFKDPGLVREVAESATPITEEWFRKRYFGVLPKNYALEYGEEDFGYTWEWFCEVRKLYESAAVQSKSIVFTVDQ